MVVGELLWASVRTRPDIAFAVSIMGQQVTKRPKWVCQLGNHVLGFLKHTWDHCLLYPSEVGGHGHDGILQIPRHEGLLEAYTDISFAPNGNRSYQGILVSFAGAPVQWEANRQSFHTLSTAESELMAAIEGMSMTQSVEALLKVMYEERVHEKVLYGDNASTISIIEKPDGPWRTRHLRLRANYLKEKLKNYPEEWKIRHQKGSTLVADLLTKPVTQIATWRRFWKALSFLVSAAHEEVADREKDTTYETDEPIAKGESGGCDCGGEESPTESNNAQDAAVKIAKVGLLLGLVEKIHWNPEHSHVKTILCIVFTVLLSFFIWQWRELSGSLLAKGRNFCRRLQVSLASSLEFDNKNQEKKEQEEQKKRVRENEPTPEEGRNVKEEKQRKDETPIEKPRDEGFFGKSPKVKGGVLEGAVDRRVVRPATIVIMLMLWLTQKSCLETQCPCRMVPVTTAPRAALPIRVLSGRLQWRMWRRTSSLRRWEWLLTCVLVTIKRLKGYQNFGMKNDLKVPLGTTRMNGWTAGWIVDGLFGPTGRKEFDGSIRYIRGIRFM